MANLGSRCWFLAISYQREPGLLREMADTKSELKAFSVLESKDLCKDYSHSMSNGHRSQLKGDPTGQIWETLGIKKNNLVK